MSDTTTASAESAVRPFRIEVPQGEIDELRRRIYATRWPTRELVTDRSQGVQLAIQNLARYLVHVPVRGGEGGDAEPACLVDG
jgi:hypothetical protein